MSWFEFKGLNSMIDYDLVITKRIIGTPEIKHYVVDVPFSSNSIDYTFINGINYNNRPIDITINMEGYDREEMYELYSRLLEWLLTPGYSKLILSDMDQYYFIAKVEGITSLEEILILGNLTISFTCRPFKYDKYECIKEFYLGAGDEAILDNSYMPSCPSIEASNICIVEYKGKEITLLKGVNKNFDITFEKGLNKVKLKQADSNIKLKFTYKKGGL